MTGNGIEHRVNKKLYSQNGFKKNSLILRQINVNNEEVARQG